MAKKKKNMAYRKSQKAGKSANGVMLFNNLSRGSGNMPKGFSETSIEPIEGATTIYDDSLQTQRKRSMATTKTLRSSNKGS